MYTLITPNFTRAEWRCPCCLKDDHDKHFVDMLQELRNAIGPMPLSSAYRCERYNKRIGGVGGAAHIKGIGADVLISGERAMQCFEQARRIGFSGIGLSQKGPIQSHFIHLDILPRKAFWTY